MQIRRVLAAAAALLYQQASAIELDLNDPDSIDAAASTIAYDMVSWYTGNETGDVPGNLPAPYYWWEAGAMFGTLIDYWYYTGDDTYNDITEQAMLFQTGPDDTYMPPNQSKSLGNDDQAFWGMAAMTAAEYKFPNPPSDRPQWLALAQGVWNSQQLRWDTSTCGGGLHWQIYSTNIGYNYKNTPSNAGLVNLGARLHAYTGNQTYADWVVKVWDWIADQGYIAGHIEDGHARPWSILDGAFEDDNCTKINQIQWSYNAGLMLNGAAVMYNATNGDSMWEERVMGIWDAARVFFRDQIMFESACEPYNNCNIDQLSFKAYFTRFLAASTKWMPQLLDEFQPYFEASAIAAAKQCSGTADGVIGTVCGFEWHEGSNWDGTYGFGQQMDALEIVLANKIASVPDPVTADKGGISEGDPTAGTSGDTGADGTQPLEPITTADTAGASILTILVVVGMLGLTWWII